MTVRRPSLRRALCGVGVVCLTPDMAKAQSEHTCQILWANVESAQGQARAAALRHFRAICPGAARRQPAPPIAPPGPTPGQRRAERERAERARAEAIRRREADRIAAEQAAREQAEREEARQRPAREQQAARAALDGVTAEQWSEESAFILAPRLLQNAPMARFLELAQGGDARAQWLAGAALYYGIGVPRSRADGMAWFQRAANAGHLRGMTARAAAHLDDREYGAAMTLYRRAADQGDGMAQAFVGYLYREGLGVAPNPAEALRWIRRSAEQNSPAGQVSLGSAYLRGEGVAQDFAQAIQLYRRAAEQGYPEGHAGLGVVHAYGWGVPINYAEARRLLTLAANHGSQSGQVVLGMLYENGWGVTRDPLEAMRWYLRAADYHNPDAQLAIGRLYENGLGVPRDLAQARIWYGRAAVRASPGVQFQLGLFDYHAGRYAEAKRWWEQAAQQGSPVAQYHIGLLYFYGHGVRQNYAEFLRWTTLAANQELGLAQYALGLAYEHGRGVARSSERATQWVRRAAGNGFPEARQWLQAKGLPLPPPTVRQSTSSGDAAGPTIQLGAFSSAAAAEGTWRELSGRFRYLAPLVHRVVTGSSSGRTVYRLFASGADARSICNRLRAAGESCISQD